MPVVRAKQGAQLFSSRLLLGLRRRIAVTRAARLAPAHRSFPYYGPLHSRRQQDSTLCFCSSQPDSGSHSVSSEQFAHEEARRQFLLKYVHEVEPQIIEHFTEHGPSHVVDAMRSTVTAMLGTLPAQFFDVSVTTVAENMAQLMYSVIMTGYMFRNAQYRVELSQSVGMLPSVATESYAPGASTSQVKGHVVRWNTQSGPEQVPAAEYIALLEKEVQSLRTQVQQHQEQQTGGNELLQYLKTREPSSMQQLTSTANTAVVDAMNAFIHRVLGTNNQQELTTITSQTSVPELAKLMFWLMVVGYSLRSIEVRFDMEKSLLSQTGVKMLDTYRYQRTPPHTEHLPKES